MAALAKYAHQWEKMPLKNPGAISLRRFTAFRGPYCQVPSCRVRACEHRNTFLTTWNYGGRSNSLYARVTASKATDLATDDARLLCTVIDMKTAGCSFHAEPRLRTADPMTDSSRLARSTAGERVNTSRAKHV